MRLLRIGVRVTAALAAVTTIGNTQVAPAASPGDDLPRVFLDCQATGCDQNFLRTELTWLNFVRDRTLASVHVLATSQTTASGGSEVTIAFIGLGDLSAKVDTVVAFSEQSATQDERRRLVSRVIAQGMLQFVAGTPVASRLTIAYRAPAVSAGASDTRGARDRWNLWVFRVGGNAFVNGEEVYKSTSINGNMRASRITAQTKTVLSLNGNYNENHYTLSAGSKLSTYRNGYGGDMLQVWSLGDHWSAGLQGGFNSSVTQNIDLSMRLGPAIEYDIYPYSQSTRRQVVVRYSLGLRNNRYDSLTVFSKMKETLPEHRLVLAAEATQPWGQIFAGASASQFLSDASKYNFNVNLGSSWRIVRGLNLNFNVFYSKIRDQIALKRGEASDEEILLRLRQLRTGYTYFGSIGLSYTFGSVFQNVVNPRFGSGSGEIMFMMQ